MKKIEINALTAITCLLLLVASGCKKTVSQDSQPETEKFSRSSKLMTTMPHFNGALPIIAIDFDTDNRVCYFDTGNVMNYGTPNNTCGEYYEYLVVDYYNTDILDMAIASNGKGYVWYNDGVTEAGNGNPYNFYNLSGYLPKTNFTLPAGKTPLNIVGITILKTNDHVYAFYDDGTFSEGTPTNLSAYSGLQSYSIPSGENYADIVDIGVSPVSGKFYAWYSDNKMSAGTVNNLSNYIPLSDATCGGATVDPVITPMAGIDIGSDDGVYFWKTDGMVIKGVSTNPNGIPQSYTLPYGKSYSDIIDMAISNSGKGYTWYKDGTMSVGYGLYNFGDFVSPKAYVLPYTKNPSNVVGITIRKSDDHVFTFYNDGTFSEGNSTDLGAYSGLQNYSISSSENYSNITDVGIATSSGWFYVWFSDNKMSVGTAYDLNSFVPLKSMD